MRLRPLLLAALALTLIPAASADAASSARARCTAKGAHTVVKTRFVRVFTTPGRGGDSTGRLYGCLLSKNKRVLLDEGTDDGIETSEEFRDVVINGRFVAWQH